jgi:hypothetical protein
MKYLLFLLLSFRCLGASVTLTWDAPTNGIPDSYIVAANANGVSWSIEGVTNRTYTMTGLSAGVRHMFQVFAVSPTGRSDGSNIASFTPSDPIVVEIPAMLPPTNLFASGVLFGSGTAWTLGLKWSDQNTNTAGFTVTAKTPEGIVLQVLKTTARNAQIPGLAFGSTNFVSIVAFDALGNESQASVSLIATMERTTDLNLKATTYTATLKAP